MYPKHAIVSTQKTHGLFVYYIEYSPYLKELKIICRNMDLRKYNEEDYFYEKSYYLMSRHIYT